MLKSIHRNPFSNGQKGSRFYSELWIICLAVCLGFYQPITVAFYRFRLVDLVLIVCVLYAIIKVLRGEFKRRTSVLLIIYSMSLLARLYFEMQALTETELLRTLLGMGAVFFTVFIYFVTRESEINLKIMVFLIVCAVSMAFLSQLGLLSLGESAAGGQMDLSKFFGFSRKEAFQFSIDYQESTIAVWRALSIGIAFALFLAKTQFWVRILGAGGILVQTAAGGGGRSILLFIFFLPIVLFLLLKPAHGMEGIKRLVQSAVIGVVFAAIYIWAPFGALGPVKGGYDISHRERATEIFILFTAGWGGATQIGGFEGRTIGYAQYWEAINSDLGIFFFGNGLSKGAAFSWTQNTLAHNMILDVWGLSGLFGLIFFMIFLGYIFIDLRDLFRVVGNDTLNQLVAFTIATAILYLFQFFLFQAVTADRSFMIIFYLTAGLLKPIGRWIIARNEAMRTQEHLRLQMSLIPP